jgi:hypothetical protein
MQSIHCQVWKRPADIWRGHAGAPEHSAFARRFHFGLSLRNATMPRTAARRKTAPRKSPQRKTGSRKSTRYWTGRITRESDALDLDKGVFSGSDPTRIAASLKRSAERSRRRKSTPYRSALSMLVFYINRAGKKLPASRRRTLERAKTELKRQFGRA